MPFSVTSALWWTDEALINIMLTVFCGELVEVILKVDSRTLRVVRKEP